MTLPVTGGVVQSSAAQAGYEGTIVQDTSKRRHAAHAARRVPLDELGWQARTGLEDVVAATCAWFVEHHAEAGL